MAAPIPSFTSSLEGLTKLVLTDTTDYTGVTISNRYWIITNSSGEATVIQQLPDVLTKIDLEKDSALIVRLAINYNPATQTQAYSKVKNVLASPNLSDAIYDMRKKFIDLLIKDDTNEVSGKLLNRIELIDSFNEAALVLISTDIVTCQQALDMGNDHAVNLNCDAQWL